MTPAAAPVAAAPPPPGEPQRSLRSSVVEGCLHAGMLGGGESYVSPFAIFLGAGSLLVGWLASLPLLVSALAQLVAVRVLDGSRAVSRRPLVVWPARLQALCWLPMAAIALLADGDVALALLVPLVLAHHALGGFVVPAWNAWIGELVPPDVRGRWWGHRERMRATCDVVARLVAGGLLSLGRRGGAEAAGFAALFAFAGAARFGSASFLGRMHEPPRTGPPRRRDFTFRDFLRRAPGNNFGRFSLTVAGVYGAANVAGPFFAMYMLRELHFSYLEFTASGIAVILAQTSAFRFWGRVADRYGNRFVLSLTGVGVVLVPLPWLLSQRFEYVLGFQVFSGLWWSGFQLGVANFIFDAVTPGRRARCVAYHNTLMHGAVLAGATVGGLLAPRLPALLPYAGALGLVSGLQVLFALSSLLRAGFVAAFIAAVREVRPVEPAPRLRALVHAVGAFPVRGLRLSLFTGDEREEDEETTAAEAGDETRTPLDQRRPSAQGPS